MIKDYTEHNKRVTDGVVAIEAGTLVTDVVVGKNGVTVGYRKYKSGPVFRALKAETAGAESALDRVKRERDDLQERLSRLCTFVDTRRKGCKFLELSPADRVLLERQKAVMQEYRDILDVRVELMEDVK